MEKENLLQFSLIKYQLQYWKKEEEGDAAGCGVERKGLLLIRKESRRSLGKGGFGFSPHHLVFSYSLYSVCILLRIFMLFFTNLT